MKTVYIFKDSDDIWSVRFNGHVQAFNSYGAALSEALFIKNYCIFLLLRGETDEGVQVVRSDEVVDPETGVFETVDILLEQSYCKDAMLNKLLKWS
jgi:hypothetical protein